MTALHQMAFDLHVPRRVQAVTPELPPGAVEHGEVFTRRWVVELILDLVGYTADLDLAIMRVIEPACGSGAFLGPIVERLGRSCRAHGRSLADARDAIRAFDLLPRNVETSRCLVEEILRRDGWPATALADAARAWIRQGDYLLRAHQEQQADFVVGNPPYIRLEDVPDERMRAYRQACHTMAGRADVYVGFFEVGLRSLKQGGRLGFICADRWMRNQYGRRLRGLITDEFSLDVTISMHEVDAFDEQVSAYPAITVLRRGQQGNTIAADTTRDFSPDDASALLRWLRDADDRPEPARAPHYQAARLPHWFAGDASWPVGSPAQLAMIEDLSDRFPPLEDPTTGTRVGIGVATGADGVFVIDDPCLIEAGRLLPLGMVRDTTSGILDWSKRYLANPWDDHGKLVNLERHPRLREYFEAHAAILRQRHVAIKRPSQWFRTIDKVDPTLTLRPKLLFPDMKLSIHPVLDPGTVYPHHNLYYVVSDTWDLRVLGGLLLSRFANAFVQAYAVKMRGGTLRFQAQYLRRIRVPRQTAITERDRAALIDAFERRDTEAATKVATRLYGLDRFPE
jgi:adenine-specific DNA-methyltransferase